MNLKKLTLTTLLASSLAAASFAGTLTEPEIQEVEEAAAGSSASSDGGILLPLLALAIVAALVASDSSDPDEAVQETATAR